MRIGYPTQNLSLGCSSSRTFRLTSYSVERLITTIEQNLDCLEHMLRYNVEHDLLYFRLSSEIIPFASHPVCTYDWSTAYGARFAELGAFARQHGMRLALHPGQYTLINSPDARIVDNSIRELAYQTHMLDLMGMDATHKVQIHVGGVYGDKPAAMHRFIDTFARLPANVQRRLAIENDERLYHHHDCLSIAAETGIPIIFDDLHYQLHDGGEPFALAFSKVVGTWSGSHGVPLVDYSSQHPDKKFGSHVDALDAAAFRNFLRRVDGYDLDIMLEIKDKEASALHARALIREHVKDSSNPSV